MFAAIVLLYNLHPGFPSDAIAKVKVGHVWYWAIDTSIVYTDKKFWRFAINLIIAGLFLYGQWNRKRSIGIVGAIWFCIQAVEVYLTGNFFKTDMPDWFTLVVLVVAWVLWEKWTPVKEAILKIVHVR